jgi:integrase
MNDAIEVLIDDLGLAHLRRESLAQLYRNGVNLGKPHYPDNSRRIEFEVGTKNDHHHCMNVLDAVVGPFQHTRSCGLARVVRLASQDEFLSFTLKGRRVSPHTLRHTTAMHLLQSGVDLTVIAIWLGHESTETTHMYVEADLALKEKALSRIEEMPGPSLRYRADDELLRFLDEL